MNIKKIIKNEKKSDALDFIMDNVLKSGFGTLNKSELDLIFFAAIINNLDDSEITDYKLSKLLQITQARVRNLKEKASVKYLKIDKSEAIDKFIEKASAGHIDGNFIDIPLNDIAIKNEIESILDEQNILLHTQLNPKIFRVRIDDFIELSVLLETEQELITNNKLDRDDVAKRIKAGLIKEIKDNIKKDKELQEKIIGNDNTLMELTMASLKECLLKGGLSLTIDALGSLIPGGFFFSKVIKAIAESASEKI